MHICQISHHTASAIPLNWVVQSCTQTLKEAHSSEGRGRVKLSCCIASYSQQLSQPLQTQKFSASFLCAAKNDGTSNALYYANLVKITECCDSVTQSFPQFLHSEKETPINRGAKVSVSMPVMP